ncbi:hypothetical protein [Cohnella rhizosphaerae]|uniref:TFIIB-type zinc ribbon-containing protein n=1 Tax=Cohnella rhizosphaerae TaxID=1457232 RepID=A0A9X4QU62_9BACL|nr:hypothetical protein [Cohnella rhizosphaerae]MDG0811931.1 hypothetical protein [Cohnella rhizosphaerae]
MGTDAKAALEAIQFPCASCGGTMLFDADSQQLKCQYCGRLQAIDADHALPREHALDDGKPEEADTDWGVAQQTIKCQSCGGESLIPALQTATLCPFCGSPKVLPQPAAATVKPESLIPFQVDKEDAAAAFRSWKKKRWFLPGAFKRENTSARLAGIYIPYWTYDADTSSAYTAERGDYHYRTVTRTRTVNGKTETYTEQERYTVWHRVSGDYDRFFNDVLIPASGQYDAKLLDRLGNFDLGGLLGYKPDYLSGYIAERYSVNRTQGWEEARERIDDALRADIRAEIGGDEVRSLNVDTGYFNRTFKHLLLPVWNASYSYKSKPYRFMVNGQTGLVSGNAPRSAWKIAFFVLACLAVVGAIVLWYTSTQQSPQ